MSLYAILLTAAVSLAVLGIANLARHNYVWGATLIVAALLVGPGGVSIFT